MLTTKRIRAPSKDKWSKKARLGRMSVRRTGPSRRNNARGRDFGRGALTAQHPIASIFSSPTVRKTQAVLTARAVDLSTESKLISSPSGLVIFSFSGSNMYDPANHAYSAFPVPPASYRPAAGHDTYAQFLTQYCIVGSRITVRLSDAVSNTASTADHVVEYGLTSSTSMNSYIFNVTDWDNAVTCGLKCATLGVQSGKSSQSAVISNSKAFGVRDCKQNGKDFDATFFQHSFQNLNSYFPENHVFHHLVIRPFPVTPGSTNTDLKDITVELEYLFYPRGPVLQKPDEVVTSQ